MVSHGDCLGHVLKVYQIVLAQQRSLHPLTVNDRYIRSTSLPTSYVWAARSRACQGADGQDVETSLPRVVHESESAESEDDADRPRKLAGSREGSELRTMVLARAHPVFGR